jgi:preprotein translocase subunit SecE
MADKIKMLVVIALLAAGIGAFYFYADQSLLLRVVGLLVVVSVATAVAYTTRMGRSTWVFVQDARTEVRKVVWPTRKETLQMSAVVIAMVILMALILWAFDSLLAWFVQLFIG